MTIKSKRETIIMSQCIPLFKSDGIPYPVVEEICKATGWQLERGWICGTIEVKKNGR